MRLGRWYVVTWHDAWSSASVDWKTMKQIDASPLKIVSAGKVVKKTKRYITLAQTVDTHSGRVSCLMAIPVGMIVKVSRARP